MAFIAIMARKGKADLLQYDEICFHHRHALGQEGPYAYKDIDSLIADFKADVEKIRRKKP